MKKQIYLRLFFLVFCLSCILNATAQDKFAKDDFDKLSLNIGLNKTNYFPLEPIFVQMEVFNKTDNSLKLLSTPDFKRISLAVVFNGKRKIFNSLFLTGQSRPGFGTIINKGQSLSENIVLETYLAEMFPEYGQYQIQFILDNGRDTDLRKEIRSEIKEIIIEKPTGINKDAVEFLRQNQLQSLFWWKEASEKESLEKNGKSLVEEFANKYSESVFGELAIYQLGLHFNNGGYIERAKLEFEKIKNSNNKYVADNAKKSLTEIVVKENSLTPKD